MKAGDPVIFKWPAKDYTQEEPKYREMIGILVSYPRGEKWLRVRIKGAEYKVPPEDVRELDE